MPEPPKDWRVPLYLNPDGTHASEANLLGNLKEARQQGVSYLKGQRSWDDIDRAFEALADDQDDPRRPSLSNVRYNISKRCIREVVAALSNLRVVPDYGTENPKYEYQAQLFNKRFSHWWYTTLADRGIRSCLQWAAVAGKGYGELTYERPQIIAGPGEIKLKAVGPRAVFPVQIGQDHDIQRAYSVTIKKEVPIFQAWAMYPGYADKLIPDRHSDSYLRRGVKRISKWLSPILNMPGQPNKEDDEQSFPAIDIYYTYVLDLTLNETGHDLLMGDPGTRWAYTVPSLGSDLPTGIISKQTGSEMVRKAEAQDAMIFPLRRLITWTENCIIRDNTSPWWHARVPLISFQMDDWPWEFLGYPLSHDTLSIQENIKRSSRARSDSMNARLRPPLKYDKNMVPKTLMDKLDPRVPLQNVGMDAQLQSMKEAIEPILPFQYYDVPQWMLDSERMDEERIKYLTGVADIAALAKARQLPGSDTMEKLLEMMGPLMQDMSRNMDGSMCELGDMFKCMVLEFDSFARRVQILGPDAMTTEDFDYDPGKLLPSHMPDESDQTGTSRFSEIERAKWFCNNFSYRVTPGTLHQITSMTKKLLYMQLARAGPAVFPMSWWRLAEVMDIPNFGAPPENTHSMLEEFIAQQRMLAELGISIAQEQQAALGVPGQPPAGAQPGVASPVGPHGGQKGTGGRPPSGNAPPQLKNRPNGGSTITESR